MQVVLLFTFVLPLALGQHGGRRRHVIHPPPIPTGPNVVLDKIATGWVEQPLDHFDATIERKWMQKYMVNDKYYKAGGPAFLQISGEGPASDGFLQTANGTNLMEFMRAVRKFNGIAFIVEHRYYGESLPVDHADKLSGMKWLTSRQALADAAQFIYFANNHYKLQTGTKWVSVGGSYAGCLSAWMRQTYPELVHASLSSSGPVQPIVDYSQYFKIAATDLMDESPECYAATDKAFNTVVTLSKTMEGRDQLKAELNLCHMVPASGTGLAVLIDSLVGPFLNVAQYGGDNRGPSVNQTVERLCDIMNDGRRSDLQKLSDVVKWQTNDDRHWACIDNNRLEGDLDLHEINSHRMWMYQTCNEFGFLQTTSAPDMPFGGDHVSLEYRLRSCADLFNITGEQVAKNVAATQLQYGGQTRNNATNIAFMNGDQDPWAVLGVFDKKWEKEGQTVIFVQGGAHCSDMYPPLPQDSQSLIDARTTIRNLIAEWLK